MCCFLSKPRTAQDELYTIPDELRVVTTEVAAKKVKIEEEQGTASSWSTGIAEVELPMTFKLRNIEETERAAQQALQVPQTTKSTGFRRFQLNANMPMQSASAAFDAQTAVPVVSSKVDHRNLRSTDDMVIQQFKVSLFLSSFESFLLTFRVVCVYGSVDCIDNTII
jgi:septation ring formation regulator EzrA